jgi:hypothetical protein
MSTFYVATTHDSNNGLSRASAYRKIDKASHTAATGDTIYIESGTYNETIIPQHDGVTYTGGATSQSPMANNHRPIHDHRLIHARF